uniref:Uncharacterized protein n=1 Tax=Steinernema glaseri TaxID=37863 RepID=A0A1I7Z740_9BILA
MNNTTVSARSDVLNSDRLKKRSSQKYKQTVCNACTSVVQRPPSKAPLALPFFNLSSVETQAHSSRCLIKRVTAYHLSGLRPPAYRAAFEGATQSAAGPCSASHAPSSAVALRSP